MRHDFLTGFNHLSSETTDVMLIKDYLNRTFVTEPMEHNGMTLDIVCIDVTVPQSTSSLYYTIKVQASITWGQTMCAIEKTSMYFSPLKYGLNFRHWYEGVLMYVLGCIMTKPYLTDLLKTHNTFGVLPDLMDLVLSHNLTKPPATVHAWIQGLTRAIYANKHANLDGRDSFTKLVKSLQDNNLTEYERNGQTQSNVYEDTDYIVLLYDKECKVVIEKQSGCLVANDAIAVERVNLVNKLSK